MMKMDGNEKMTSEQISIFISDLMLTLDLKSSEDVSWSNFLARLALQVNASSGRLISSDVARPDYVEAEYLFSSGASSINTTSISWSFSIVNSQILLGFEREEEKQQAEVFWQQLGEQINEIYTLGMRWQESQDKQKMTDTFIQGISLGVATFDENGYLETQSGIVSELIESKALEVFNNTIRLTSEPSWLSQLQKEMISCDAEYLSSHRVINTQTGSYRCEVFYQRKVNNNWKVKDHQFSMVIYANAGSCSSKLIKSLYSMTSAEAEVASFFSEGLSAEDVARETGYAISTVYSYIKKLYGSLGINKQSQLTAAIWPELPVAAIL